MRNSVVLRAALAAVLAFSGTMAQGAVWYVDGSIAASGDGTSWATAFKTVQEGIDAPADDVTDEVWVREGIYPVVENNGGDSLTMRERGRLYGGFAGTETALEQRNPALRLTVLLGTAAGDLYTDPKVPVVTAAGNSLLDGFTIRNGRALQGGGLYCFRVAPTIRNCVFEDNIAIQDENVTRSGWGGAVMIVGGVAPLFEDCVFRNNRGLLGGAMALENGRPNLRDCRFENNEAYLALGPVPGVPGDLWQDQTGSGGAIYGFEQAKADIRNCVFDSNRANTLGGALSFFERCDAVVRDSVFTNNTALRDPQVTGFFPGGRAGAVEIQWDSSTFERCLFTGNASSDDGGAVFVGGLRAEVRPEFDEQFLARAVANPSFTNCIFLGNAAGGAGGGVMMFESQATFDHCTFANNAAARQDPNSGGAIHALFFSTPTLRNTIAWDNIPFDVFDLPEVDFDPGEGEIINVPESATLASFSNIGLVSSPESNLTDDGLLVGEGNISDDPLFSTCNAYDQPEDVGLREDSPSLGTGDPENSALVDYRQTPREGEADMGALTGVFDRDCSGFETGPHSADVNANAVIELSELLRVIQLFNLGAFGCGEETEDGFAIGSLDLDCLAHSSDYAPQNWSLQLIEILRVIQIFNAGGYTECPSGEDGFCIL